jgi:hypothetical protein
LALQHAFPNEEIQIIGSDIANKWTHDGGEKLIEEDMENLGLNPHVIINTAGQLDPNKHISSLLGVNFYLPKNLELYSRKHGIKLVTFGTVMENLEDLSKSNPYLLSKRRYFEFLTNEALPNSNSLHLQIHTWYGGASLHSHMFLGQMFSALENKKRFQMSSGIQLREYHSIYDDISAAQYLLSQDANGVIQINHGEILSLKEIAISIFDSFNASDLLEIGSLKAPEYEIIERKFERLILLESVNFRATRPGIINDFQRLLEERK